MAPRDQTARRLRWLQGPGDAKSIDVAPGVRVRAVTAGRPKEPRQVPPRTTAQNPLSAIAAIWRGPAALTAARPATPTIGYPLHHISMHVKEPEAIGDETTNRRGPLEVPPRSTAVAVGMTRSDFVAPGIPGARAGPCRVLPLGLTRQTIDPAGLTLIQPTNPGRLPSSR